MLGSFAHSWNSQHNGGSLLRVTLVLKIMSSISANMNAHDSVIFNLS